MGMFLRRGTHGFDVKISKPFSLTYAYGYAEVGGRRLTQGAMFWSNYGNAIVIHLKPYGSYGGRMASITLNGVEVGANSGGEYKYTYTVQGDTTIRFSYKEGYDSNGDSYIQVLCKIETIGG